MATTNSPPTLLIANAIATLSKSLNAALAKAEDDARIEIARAATETRESLRERDDIRKTLHESQLEEQAWKQEVGVWKAKVDNVEMANKHQTETISQLRQEARQWQDQCIRLEETSRDWKEQFLRVEQERQILLARIDELVAEKMIYSTQASISAPFYTPNSNYNEIAEPSMSSATTKRGSTSSNPFQTNGRSVLPPSPTDQVSPSENLHKNPQQRSKTSRLRPQRDQETQVATLSHPAKDTTRPPSQKSSATKTPRHQTQTHDTSRSQQRRASSPTRIARQEMRSEPRQQVIRRVTTTFEVPVKEEEIDDDEEYAESASASTSVHSADLSPTTEVLHARKAKSSRQKARQQSRRSVREEDDDSYVEEEEEEEGGESHAHAGSSEEEDDELMMGAENNRKEVYGTHRVPATPVRPNGTSTISKSGGSSTKKRKQAVGRASGGSATKARRL